jgi:hypothetical protein
LLFREDFNQCEGVVASDKIGRKDLWAPEPVSGA